MEIIIIVLLYASTVSAASLKAQMPLLTNNLRSNLYAELDISDVNQQIKEYIDSNVENQVNDTFQAQIEHIVDNKISELKVEMLKDFSKSMNQTKDKYGYELYTVVQHVHSELSKLLNDSKKEFDEFKQNLIATNAEWKEDVLKETKETMKQLEEIKKDSVFDKPVALTSCGRTISPSRVIKFDNVVTQMGFVGISQFNTTGKFTCEKAGLYLISVHIMSNNDRAYYSIQKNSVVLSKVYIAEETKYNHYTGTGIVTVNLQSGDEVWVAADNIHTVYGLIEFSCMSIVKIK